MEKQKVLDAMLDKLVVEKSVEKGFGGLEALFCFRVAKELIEHLGGDRDIQTLSSLDAGNIMDRVLQLIHWDKIDKARERFLATGGVLTGRHHTYLNGVSIGWDIVSHKYSKIPHSFEMELRYDWFGNDGYGTWVRHTEVFSRHVLVYDQKYNQQEPFLGFAGYAEDVIESIEKMIEHVLNKATEDFNEK
jgi:hypothetical protein